MNLEQAIKTAIEYEKNVEGTYADAVAQCDDAVGKRIFSVLAKEEAQHVQYLEASLARWQQEGKVSLEALDTALPSRQVIEGGLSRLKESVEPRSDPRPQEIELLRRAVRAEQETSGFYKKMVEELGEDGKAFFERFVEIEEGHLLIVGAELDAVSGMGYWFDMPEWQFVDG